MENRTLFRWVGGKNRRQMKNWILPLIPDGGLPYCEPFVGSGAIILARDPAPVEVVNDLDGGIVAIFRVLQDPEKFARFQHRIKYTLFSYDEYKRAIENVNSDDEEERAWAHYVRFNQAFGAQIRSETGWGRCVKDASYGMSSIVSGWQNRKLSLDFFSERMMRIQVENRDAIDVIKFYDNPEAVFYVDPPYLPTTRNMTKVTYRHDCDSEFHEHLVEVLASVEGSVVLSGYSDGVYKSLEDAGWKRSDKDVQLLCAERSHEHKRVESIWQNPMCLDKLGIGCAKCTNNIQTELSFKF